MRVFAAVVSSCSVSVGCELAQLDALYRKDDVDDGKAPEPKVPWDAALYVKDPAEYAPGPFLLRDS